MNQNDKWAIGILFELALILAGLDFCMWFSHLPNNEQQLLMHRTLSLTTFIVAQPGVLMTTWIITNSKLSWAETIIRGMAVFLLFACALPIAISNWLLPVFLNQ